nr:cyclin-Y-like [Dermatophagoides farinae]
MGNRFSCCKTHGESLFKHRRRRLSRRRRKESSQTTLNNAEIKYDETILSLQHISERELPETNHDPSTNPTAGPLFVQRSATFTNNNINHNNNHHHHTTTTTIIIINNTTTTTINTSAITFTTIINIEKLSSEKHTKLCK